MKKYFVDIFESIRTILVGLGITWSHLFTKACTVQYPDVKWELPEGSRMRLFNKIEDCIGCGQCVRACPVDCIYMTTEKLSKEGAPWFASDGTPIKLKVTQFDIDMSLCCYCNLCTFPCPTHCLVMTPEYEFAVHTKKDFLYRFAKEEPSVISEPAAQPTTN